MGLAMTSERILPSSSEGPGPGLHLDYTPGARRDAERLLDLMWGQLAGPYAGRLTSVDTGAFLDLTCGDFSHGYLVSASSWRLHFALTSIASILVAELRRSTDIGDGTLLAGVPAHGRLNKGGSVLMEALRNGDSSRFEVRGVGYSREKTTNLARGKARDGEPFGTGIIIRA